MCIRCRTTVLLFIIYLSRTCVDASCSNPDDVRDVTATSAARRIYFPFNDAPSSSYDVCYDWRITGQPGELLELFLIQTTQYDQPCTVGRSCLRIFDGYNYSAVFGFRKMYEEDGNVTEALRLAYPAHQSVFIRFFTYENSSFLLQHKSRGDIDDGGFSSKDKKSLGIALTSCAVAVIAIVIAMFTVLVCSRTKDKETTGSESGLVPERSRREPDNLSRLFEARPSRQNMSAL
ncbi:uncharacterized protein [Magallana gigas]|uniref:uncharacterized protein n=1 Tax=Magallana gigas TaxID=29159 RepID=UPI0033414FA0